MAKRKPIIFSTASYGYLMQAMLNAGQFEVGEFARGLDKAGNPVAEVIPFPDGEFYHRLMTDVEGRKVIIVGGHIDDRETMELYDMANTLVDCGAGELRIVDPYYGYCTMERAVKRGEAVKAKYRARLLSSIPKAVAGNQIYFVDLHAEGIQHYVEGTLHSHHIYAKSVVVEAVKAQLLLRANNPTCKAIQRKALAEPFVFASTDAGRAKWVESLTRDMVAAGFNVTSAFIIKDRIAADKTKVRQVSADVKDRSVIIYDDMIRTGGSLREAADAYLKLGAVDVAAIATHCVMPGNTKDKLRDSGFFTHIAVTDSHPRSILLQDDFLSVHSIAPLLAKTVANGRLQLG